MVTTLIVLFCFVVVTVASPVKEPGNYGAVMEILNTMQHQIQEVQQGIQEVKGENKLLTEEISILQDHYSADVNTLFLATISTETMAVSDDEPIPWDFAPINPGGHFSTVTGGYTAPYNGYYQFSVTKRSSDYGAYFWLLIDQDRYLYNYEIDDYHASPSASTTINIQLTAGQIVRVENDFSTLIYGMDSAGSIRSWFTGYMLYAL